MLLSCKDNIAIVTSNTPTVCCQNKLSDKIILAINTPKNGLRKWNAAAFIGPIEYINLNQINVAINPGKIVV